MKHESVARYLKGKALHTQLHRARRKSLAPMLTEETGLTGRRKTGGLPSFLGVGRNCLRDVAEKHESLLWVRRCGNRPPKNPSPLAWGRGRG